MKWPITRVRHQLISTHTQCVLVLAATAMASTPLLASPAAPEEAVADDELAAAIETHLGLDSRVAAYQVTAEVEDGVAILRGSVDNALAKHYALQIAGRTAGVRSVVNLIAIDAPAIDDPQLERDIVEALQNDPATEPYEVSVSVQDGVVGLTGTVQSQAERHLAQFAVAGVRGVRAVENDLTVQSVDGREDDEIEEEIRRRIETSAWVDGSFVDIDVQDGQVALSGSVPSVAEHLEVRRVAWVNGVKSLDHAGLQVNSFLPDQSTRQRRPLEVGDQSIEKAIQDALKFDPRVATREIGVTVSDHVATLQGKVRTIAERRAAVEDAWNAYGVMDVTDRLQVLAVENSSDRDVEMKVERMLSLDPYVNRFDVHVSVQRDHVYLHGSVDTLFDKVRAEEIAERVEGVLFVNNELKVDGPRRVADRDIKSAIEEWFVWDVRVDADAVDVHVQNGTVVLTGEVASHRERVAAARIAQNAGAQRVDNQLKVSR